MQHFFFDEAHTKCVIVCWLNIFAFFAISCHFKWFYFMWNFSLSSTNICKIFSVCCGSLISMLNSLMFLFVVSARCFSQFLFVRWLNLIESTANNSDIERVLSHAFSTEPRAERELMHTNTTEFDDKWEIALGREHVKNNDDNDCDYNDGKKINKITL